MPVLQGHRAWALGQRGEESETPPDHQLLCTTVLFISTVPKAASRNTWKGSQTPKWSSVQLPFTQTIRRARCPLAERPPDHQTDTLTVFGLLRRVWFENGAHRGPTPSTWDRLSLAEGRPGTALGPAAGQGSFIVYFIVFVCLF